MPISFGVWAKMLLVLSLMLSVDGSLRRRTAGAGARVAMVAKSFSLVAFFPCR